MSGLTTHISLKAQPKFIMIPRKVRAKLYVKLRNFHKTYGPA